MVSRRVAAGWCTGPDLCHLSTASSPSGLPKKSPWKEVVAVWGWHSCPDVPRAWHGAGPFFGFSCAVGVAPLASVESLLQEPIAQCCFPWHFELAALTCAGGVQGYRRSVVSHCLSSSELFLGSLLQHKRKEQNHINPLFPPLADQNLDGFFGKMLYFLGFQPNVSRIRKMQVIGARAARCVCPRSCLSW